MTRTWSLTDGLVTLRPSTPDDAPVLVVGRDAEFHRFLGEGSESPQPTACIVVAGEVVGWVDYDHERAWLDADEVNLGYSVFADHRGHGYATRGVLLLVQHLAEATEWRVASLLIHRDNMRSLAVARRAGFDLVGPMDDSLYWKRPVGLVFDDDT